MSAFRWLQHAWNIIKIDQIAIAKKRPLYSSWSDAVEDIVTNTAYFNYFNEQS